MKAYLTPRDLQRLPMETRVAIDMMLERGAELGVVSKRKCREALIAAPIRPYRIVDVGTPCDNRTDRVRRANDKPNWHRLDEWDLVQAFAPVHQPPSRYFDVASANAMLKEFYSPDQINHLAYGESPMLHMLPPFTSSLDR